jgi:hypothetical protein
MSSQDIFFDNSDPTDDVGQLCFRRFSNGSFQVYADCDPESDMPICAAHGNLSADDALILVHWLIDQITTHKEVTNE